MPKIITRQLLRDWEACKEGAEVFVSLFPNGATLADAMAGLDAAGHGLGNKKHDDWSLWLFEKARKSTDFVSDVSAGYKCPSSYGV